MLLIGLDSCEKPIPGCTNPKAGNYNAEANEDDGSCQIKLDGIYFLKDSIFYNNVFNELKTYELTVEFLSSTDSIALREVRGVSVTKDLKAKILGTSLQIYPQPFDPNAEASGSGTFDFGIMNFEFNYGFVTHVCEATKN